MGNFTALSPKQKEAGLALSDALTKALPHLKEVLPAHMKANAATFRRTALLSTMYNAEILACGIQSVVGAVIQAAQLGLEPSDLTGKCYLIARKERGHDQKVAHLMVGYKGLIQLMRQSGDVQNVYARVVRDGDEFQFEQGTEEFIRHIPKAGNKGDIQWVYAVAKLARGGHTQEVMSFSDIEHIRREFGGGGQYGPWKTHWDAMAKKTVIRSLAKILPTSSEALQRAVAVDERTEAGVWTPPPVQPEDFGIEHAIVSDRLTELGGELEPAPTEE